MDMHTYKVEKTKLLPSGARNAGHGNDRKEGRSCGLYISGMNRREGVRQ